MAAWNGEAAILSVITQVAIGSVISGRNEDCATGNPTLISGT